MAASPRTLVWLADVAGIKEDAPALHAGWLGAGERERLARFVRLERRIQFLAGRVLLRRALGALLGFAPESIGLQERPGLGPALLHPAAASIGFSISHSGRWVACAASTESALGLDIERIDPARDVQALARQAFGSAQAARLAACPEPARVATFYRTWCEHEARIKLALPAAKIYSLARPGLSCALACASPLPADPVLEQVRVA